MAGFFSKLAKAMSNKKYRKNPENKAMTPEEQLFLNIGAINAEQTMCYCDSLETGLSSREAAENLSNSYGIVNRQTALETLTWLKERGHRVYFEAIRQFAAGMASGIEDSRLEEEEKTNTYEYINNLKAAADTLLKRGYIRSKADFGTASIAAWDMGRLVLVTRCCYDCGYITQQEAWELLAQACEKCRTDYADWRELAQGYVIGRGMWAGENMMLGGIISIADDLLKDTDSPWQQVPLR